MAVKAELVNEILLMLSPVILEWNIFIEICIQWYIIINEKIGGSLGLATKFREINNTRREQKVNKPLWEISEINIINNIDENLSLKAFKFNY